MKKMGIQAVYPKPKTTIINKAHKIYPYMLRNLSIDWINKVLSWRLSNRLDTDFCVEALEETIERFGRPNIFNTDQGSLFTSDKFTDDLREKQINISMDGKGRWMSNVLIERLWHSLKYEEEYLKAYKNIWEAEQIIRVHFDFYNQ